MAADRPPTLLSNRQRRRALYRAQRQRRLHARDAGKLGNEIAVDALEIARVLIGDAQQIIGEAGEQITFDDLGMTADLGLETVERRAALLVERHRDIGDA